MSALFQRGLLQSEKVLVQCKRYGSKINIQRPRPPHYTRKLFNAVTEPVYPRRTAIDLCFEKQALQKLEKEKEEKLTLHQYDAILARELHGFFNSAQMILICQKNSMSAFDYFNFRVAMHKKNIKTTVYGRKIIRGALEDTKFSSLLPLLSQTTYNCMLFSDEWNIKDALNVLKKTQKMILLAGVLGDRFMSRSELENYAKLPDLQVSRAQFVATMNSVGGQLTNHLQAHQSNFAYMLDAHAEALKTADANTGTSTSATNENSPTTTETTTDEKST
ncbi:39S ribosomal protein L10, mitochondrial [Contarinia nasturtii]|uniref:39S ribosomal protein L10, mitochondrial n=1 Tax=Contarinia nasturtii TaxID=265458 RepID=UPI0012D4395B|nr:39S ribosomal protein L10, mitochondrial [Contarinia nasturtii]